MTEPRPWPNNAKEDRDRAAEQFQQIIRAGRDMRAILMDGEFTRDELLYLCSLVVDHAQTGIRHLERQGAQTIPLAESELSALFRRRP